MPRESNINRSDLITSDGVSKPLLIDLCAYIIDNIVSISLSCDFIEVTKLIQTDRVCDIDTNTIDSIFHKLGHVETNYDTIVIITGSNLDSNGEKWKSSIHNP